MKVVKGAIALTLLAALAGCSSTENTIAVDPLSVNGILDKQHTCSETIQLRHQSIDDDLIEVVCPMLLAKEATFHQLFQTKGRPVKDDNNTIMRANIYTSREEFVKYATNHFNMPTGNGGMYLEGLPQNVDNQAEFVAYVKNGKVWNLGHEYIHYLDGRFNQYGDYCKGLHDDHSGPEFCAQPTPAYPHLVWWGEGIAEYIAKGNDNPKATEIFKRQRYALSEIFNTSYNNNGGSDRVYRFGYLAVRYMLENHKNRVEKMLALTRQGDYAGYQALVKSWGRTMDQDFDRWAKAL